MCSAQAQEFSRYLSCEGSVSSGGEAMPAYVDMALRFNNTTALIQRSNILPVGERLAYIATPAAYSMTYLLRPQGTTVFVIPGWFSNSILTFSPDLKRLNAIRMSINRQTGTMEGELLNEADRRLGTFEMKCSSKSEQELGAPKY
jgi:hypothetical protein